MALLACGAEHVLARPRLPLMFVANSFNADRGITGDLHLLAFYRTALTPEQVTINYAAGPDPIE